MIKIRETYEWLEKKLKNLKNIIKRSQECQMTILNDKLILIKTRGTYEIEKFKESLERPYEWLQKKLKEINREDLIKRLLQYQIIFDSELIENSGEIDREEKVIRMNPPTPAHAEDMLVHELLHALRENEFPTTPEINEGAATFVELLYGIERGGEIAEVVHSRLMGFREYCCQNLYNGKETQKGEETPKRGLSRLLSRLLLRPLQTDYLDDLFCLFRLLLALNARIRCKGLCIFLDIANKHGLNEALKSSIELVTPKDFEERYGEFPTYPPNLLFDHEEFSKYLKILEDKSRKTIRDS